MQEQLTINAPDVVGELLDGEVVVINLATGVYYSMRGVAGVVWGALERGATEERVLEEVRARCSGVDAAAEEGVRAHLARLLEEGLVVKRPGAGSGAETALAAAGAPIPYETPAFEKFTDMKDMLLLDPIHEVDDRGWPHQA